MRCENEYIILQDFWSIAFFNFFKNFFIFSAEGRGCARPGLSPDIRGGGAVQRGCFSVAVLFCKWVPERTENFFFWLFCYAPLNEAGAEPRLAGLTVDALQLPFSIPPAVFLSLAPALLFLLRSKVRPDAGFLI